MGRENSVVLALVGVLLELGVLVSGAIIYPSVQWSFQNPRFKQGTFRLNVLPLSKINIICPHMATSLLTTDDSNSNSHLENFWIVDRSSYLSCNVNTSITENKILFKCDKPLQLNFEQLVFQSLGMDNSAVFKKGRTYYFISTSTGSQDSLNNTNSGHCLTDNMKMQIYICNGTQDPACNVKTEPSTTATTATTAGTAILEPATQAARKLASSDVWHLLTIILGVCIGVSVVIHSVCLFVVCRRRSKKKQSDKDRLRPETDENVVENKVNSCRA